MKRIKKYVDVLVLHTKEGKILPKKIFWEDDIPYEIDRITAIEPRASLRAGGAGIRYTCRVSGNMTYLFLEEDKWFVEQKVYED